MSAKNFVRDLYLIAKNIGYISSIFTSSKATDQEWRKQHSERVQMSRTLPKFATTVYNLLLGERQKDCAIILKEFDSKCEHWFFINGITTSSEVAAINEIALEDVFKREFHTLYNPTGGLLVDIIECTVERTFDQYATITKQLFEIIDDLIYQKKRVRIIAHSQGGIILSNFLKLLKHYGRCQDYSNLEVYTFASAADEDVEVDGVYQEHFGNQKDFVSRIGLMTLGNKDRFFTLNNETGHLLNQDYLEHFRAGKYCNGKSKLFSYTK